jgi:cytochrome c oxidase subunit 2
MRGRNQLPAPARANNIGAMNVIFSALSPLRICLLAVALPAFGLAVIARAAEPKSRASRGAALYAACAQCHGEMGEGIEATKAPRLAGREDWFIKKQLEQFRRRERGKDDSNKTGLLPPEERTQFMHPVADKLTRADIKALIAHLATLRPEPVPPARLGDAGRGRALYGTCIECHGKTGEGNRRQGAPRLAGQHDWYLFNQLRDFRMGWRGTESKNVHVKIMRSRLDLDDEALHDLAAYIVSLNPQTPAPPVKR